MTAEVLVYLRYSRGHQLLCDVGIYKFHLKEWRHLFLLLNIRYKLLFMKYA